MREVMKCLGLVVCCCVLSGCGGNTCGNDICGANTEFDSVVDVPDTGATDVTGATDAADEIDRDSSQGADQSGLPGDVDAPSDVYIGLDLSSVEGGLPCRTCQVDEECGTGSVCVPVGAEKHCLYPCNDDGDCENGFVCYATSPQLHQCLPMTYTCVACMGDEPCPDGSCCDFTTGECKTCMHECDPCTRDYDCASGLRCLSTGGAAGRCVPDCTNDACLDFLDYTCTERGNGVSLCVPGEGVCPQCSADKPYILDGECVECRADDQCLLGMACDVGTHTCAGCRDGLMSCGEAGCAECCSDADCIAKGIVDKGCGILGACDRELTCGDGCPEVFPVCAFVGGVEQCVQCLTDVDCVSHPGCGDCTSSHVCMGAGNETCAVASTCPATCETAANCPPAWDDAVQQCFVPTDGGAGSCFDPAGTCNGVAACCGPGMKCAEVDIGGILQDGGIMLAGDRIVAPPPRDTTFCECETTADCINGKECTPLMAVCEYPDMPQTWLDILCPGGQPLPSLPAKVCGTLQEIMIGHTAG